MKKTISRYLLFLLLLSLPTFLFSAENGEQILSEGIDDFQQGEYRDAIMSFRDLLVNPDLGEYRGDGYYWIARANIAIGNLSDAEKHLEYFLLNYSNHPRYAEGIYQKGRLLYLQEDYDKSIQVLQTFIENYPSSPYRANAFFWLGECLYALGRLDSATSMYQTVINEYPTSYRVEAARYRLSLIDLKKREQELLKLLKWSHEENLQLLETLKEREKTYNEALESYQDQIKSLVSEDTRQEISRLTNTIRNLEKELRLKTDYIAELEEELEKTKAEDGEITGAQEKAAPESQPEEAADISELRAELRRRLELVKIKEEALKIKESLIEEIEKADNQNNNDNTDEN